MRRGRATCGPGSGAGHAQRAHRLRGSLRTRISLGAAKRGGRCWRPGAAPGRAPSTCKNFPSGGDAPLVPQHQPPGHPGTGSCLLRAAATHVSPSLLLPSCPVSAPHLPLPRTLPRAKPMFSIRAHQPGSVLPRPTSPVRSRGLACSALPWPPAPLMPSGGALATGPLHWPPPPPLLIPPTSPCFFQSMPHPSAVPFLLPDKYLSKGLSY